MQLQSQTNSLKQQVCVYSGKCIDLVMYMYQCVISQLHKYQLCNIIATQTVSEFGKQEIRLTLEKCSTSYQESSEFGRQGIRLRPTLKRCPTTRRVSFLNLGTSLDKNVFTTLSKKGLRMQGHQEQAHHFSSVLYKS